MMVKSIARFAYWSIFSEGFQALIGVVGLIVLARLLQPEEFGLAAMSLMVVRLLNLFSEFLFTETLIQRKKLLDVDIESAFWASLILASCLIGVASVFSDEIADILGQPEISNLIRLASTMMIFGAMNGIFTGLLRRENKFRELGICVVGGRFLGLLAAVLMAFADMGATSLVAQQVIGFAVTSIALWGVVKWQPRFNLSIHSLQQLLPFSLIFIAGETIKVCTERVIPLIIGVVFGPLVLGYFDLAVRISEAIGRFIGMAAHQVNMSVFSRYQSDNQGLSELIYRATAYVSILGMPLFGALVVIAPDLVTLVFGDKWNPIIPLIQLLAIASMFKLCGFVFNTSILAVGRPKWRAFKYAAEFIVGVSFVLLLRQYGLIGIGVAFILMNVLTFPILIYANKEVVEFGRSMRVIFSPIIVMVTTGVIVVFLRHQFIWDLPIVVRMLLTIVTVVLVYFVSIGMIAPARIRELYVSIIGAFEGSPKRW